MSLTSLVTKLSRTGNSTARTFSFSPIVIFADSELEVKTVVITTGVETTRTLGTGATNYSINIAAGAYPATGSIEFPAAGGTLLPSTEKIHIRRILPLDQQTKLSRGPYDPAVQEEQFDRFAALFQQMQNQLDRCLLAPMSLASTVAMAIPPLVTGSRYLRFNSDKDGWELVELTATGTAVVSDATPAGVALNTATPGTSADVSRADHAHLVDVYIKLSADIHNKLNFI
jgi:hypothetical protein